MKGLSCLFFVLFAFYLILKLWLVYSLVGIDDSLERDSIWIRKHATLERIRAVKPSQFLVFMLNQCG